MPLIVRGPGIGAGGHCQEPVVGYDLLPTVMDFAAPGSVLPAGVEGAAGNPCSSRAVPVVWRGRLTGWCSTMTWRSNIRRRPFGRGTSRSSITGIRVGASCMTFRSIPVSGRTCRRTGSKRPDGCRESSRRTSGQASGTSGWHDCARDPSRRRAIGRGGTVHPPPMAACAGRRAMVTARRAGPGTMLLEPCPVQRCVTTSEAGNRTFFWEAYLSSAERWPAAQATTVR